MNLSDVKLNTNCVVKSVNIVDELTKIRVMELGIVSGVKIMLKHKSILKKLLWGRYEGNTFNW